MMVTRWMTSSRDFQRSKVYRWERTERLGHHVATPQEQLTLEECYALVVKYWRRYRPEDPHPRLEPGRGCRGAHGGAHKVVLPRWARQPVVVLHETAHAIIDYGMRRGGWHGPVWMHVFLELLEAEGLRQYDDLAASARQAGLKIASAGMCPRPRRATQTDEEKREQRAKWGKAYRDRKRERDAAG